MAGYEDCKHQPLMSPVNDNVHDLMYSGKAVFTYSEIACNEGQTHRFTLTTVQHLHKCYCEFF
jgi:hypothetical protein